MTYTFDGAPDWERFYGNNHEHIDTGGISYGGCVSFSDHIGKPLTQRLWQDLLFRLKITGLCIFGPGAC